MIKLDEDWPELKVAYREVKDSAPTVQKFIEAMSSHPKYCKDPK